MKRIIVSIIFLFSMSVFGQQISLNISNLGNLGPNFDYEGWIIVNGAPISTGTFTVDDNGNLSQTVFPVDSMDLSQAVKFVLTIEPVPDPDPSPSSTHILAGAINSNTADLSVGDPAVFGDDFMSSTGYYLLATPTDDDTMDERSGLWFINMGAPGLNVPTLPLGWSYEGWAVINGTPVTTGKFTMVDEADSSAPYSGPNQGPPFPGEDFLMNPPNGLTFPTDLRGDKAVLTIEPDPDNASTPFFLKPLVGQIDSMAVDHTPYAMNNNASTFPTGMATISFVTAVNDASQNPAEFKLSQNYPNPFNPTTRISYSIPNRSNVVLKIYDILGNEVATLVNGVQNAGSHTINFNAENLASGTYIYRIQTENHIAARKLILLK